MSNNLTENINKEIEKLESQINRLNFVKKLIETYPDLHERTDRWNNKYYSSASINSQVDKVTFKHSCGCCADAPLLALFYKDVNGIKIYADPYSITIGESYASGYGDISYHNWKETLRKYNIPVEMDAKVEEYFAKNPPEDYEEDEEEF